MEVKTDALGEYARNLDGPDSAADAIREYAHTYGCDKSGFTGLLTLLQPEVDLDGSLFDEPVIREGTAAVLAFGGSHGVAKTYEEQDRRVTKALEEILSQLDGTTGYAPDITGS
jgi:hypothetical protein